MLKIDHTFIAKMNGDHPQTSLVLAIIRMAQELDLQLVAEGIENQQQIDYLIDLGCQFGQGYLLCRPLSGEAMEQFLRESKTHHLEA